MTVNHEKFFHMAAQVAKDATCKRARCGSIVVGLSGEVLGVGFNAPPLGEEGQRQCDYEGFNLTTKAKSDKTCCVHAEWNAILNSCINHGAEIAGATLYFMRIDDEGNFTDAGEPYCTVCSRLALQSGIQTFGLWENGPRMIDTFTYNTLSYEYHK
jgi:deoxycytidylate deaminase